MASLKEIAQQQVKEAFDNQLARQGLAQAVTFKKLTGSTYNTTTGAPEKTYSETAGINALMTGYKAGEYALSGGKILSTDHKCLIPTLSLTGVTPAQHDQVEDADGNVWNVVSAKKDPADAVHIIQLRSP